MKPLSKGERAELLSSIEGLTHEDIETWEASLADELFFDAHPERRSETNFSADRTSGSNMQQKLDAYFSSRYAEKRLKSEEVAEASREIEMER